MADTPSSQYPNLNPNGGSIGMSSNGSFEQNKNALANSAQNAMDSVKNSQTVQTITNGPVAEKTRAEIDNTRNEFSNLAASKQTPQTTTANGQNLTHYHSLFYNVLSWENPRATAVSYATIALAIFAFRYMPVARYGLKVLYMVLGITAAAEIAGKTVLGQGFSSKMRPKRYYTIPRETLESILADAEELTNFFVIEFQRIIFAENVYVTLAAFATSLLSYFLIKFMPTWGMLLFFTTLVYFAPLAYIQNKDFIDHHINNAGAIVSDQATQVRDLASHHANNAMEMSQSAFQEYSAKAQEMIGQGKKSAVEQGVVSPQTAEKVAPEKSVSSSDFPAAPKQELLLNTETGAGAAAPVHHEELKTEQPLAA